MQDFFQISRYPLRSATKLLANSPSVKATINLTIHLPHSKAISIKHLNSQNTVLDLKQALFENNIVEIPVANQVITFLNQSYGDNQRLGDIPPNGHSQLRVERSRSNPMQVDEATKFNNDVLRSEYLFRPRFASVDNKPSVKEKDSVPSVPITIHVQTEEDSDELMHDIDVGMYQPPPSIQYAAPTMNNVPVTNNKEKQQS